MDKDDVVHIDTMEYIISHKKELGGPPLWSSG